jgi:hypothetical protein
MSIAAIIDQLREQQNRCRIERVVAMAELVETMGEDELAAENVCLASYIGEPSVPAPPIALQFHANRD